MKINNRAFFLTVLTLFALDLSAQWNTVPPDAVEPDWRRYVPQPVYPDTTLIGLYEKAWQTAAGRVRRGPDGMVASPYLDENCYDDQIWIWDGCFMVMFSKYAPEAFPGKETLMNYYVPIHDGGASPLRIHLRDNPPLFAWVELENYKFTGDTAQITEVLTSKKYLQRHYEYFNSLERGTREERVSPNPIFLKVYRDSANLAQGYGWNGNGSGMDNTPRGRGAGGWNGILWIDAISQQALAARCIAELCDMTGDESSTQWWAEYERVKGIVNDNYWDERDGFYYDIDVESGEPCRVGTPASFWAMLAGIPDESRAAKMVDKLRTEDWFGGHRPWNSLTRNDVDFDSVSGNYWRGGIWLPIAYMGTKALERYGYTELADSLASDIVNMMARVYYQQEPHTIWETYNPMADGPSTEHGHTVRQEFCGWSALGPISLFIENVLGFRNVNALTRTVIWDLKKGNGTHGLRHFKFGNVVADIVYNADDGMVDVDSNEPFSLILNGQTYNVPRSKSQIPL